MIELIPAIDLIDGKCVRLTQGDYDTKKVYNEDPLEVAKMLSEDARYQDICDKTGASSATVSRVNRALHYGEDGYALVLERLKNESEDGSANRHE